MCLMQSKALELLANTIIGGRKGMLLMDLVDFVWTLRVLSEHYIYSTIDSGT